MIVNGPGTKSGLFQGARDGIGRSNSEGHFWAKKWMGWVFLSQCPCLWRTSTVKCMVDVDLNVGLWIDIVTPIDLV